MRFCIAALSLFLLASGSSRGQTPVESTTSFRADTTLVLVPVGVTDKNNRYVLGLEKENFQILEDGAAQTITHFSSEDAPLSVGLIVDVSGSIGMKLNTSRQAVSEFLKTLNAQDEAFLVECSDQAEMTLHFTHDTAAIDEKLKSATSGGLTALLDAVRLGPDDDETEVTAVQVREVVARLAEAGQWRVGDPDILVVFDAGYDITRLTFLLAGLPVQLLGRLRSDRVLYFPAPPGRADGKPGRPPRHGNEFRLADPATWPDPAVTTVSQTARYGTARACSWERLHPKLERRGGWEHHDGALPVMEGTIIRLQVDHLPGDRDPKPVWLWTSRTGATPAEIDRCWQAFLRRFDLEHTFRLFKQVLGWTAPKIRDPAAADRWTWIVIACHTQLRLARLLAADLRRPWERPAPPGRLTPARVRRGFRRVRAMTTCLASAPKPGKPGPGRPPGSKNRRPATRHNVGKNRKAGMAKGTGKKPAG